MRLQTVKTQLEDALHTLEKVARDAENSADAADIQQTITLLQNALNILNELLA
ncbi:MAG: hypothetical protein QXL54_03805 [Candidatus Bathyarchaeia archaeon]